MIERELLDELKSTFSFIKELNERELDELLAYSRYIEIPENVVLMDEGKKCSGISLIIEGTVRIYRLSPEGREITLYRISNGETCVLAVSCIMGESSFPVIAVTEQEVRMLNIPVEYFKQIFYSNPVWQKFVFQAMANKLMDVMTVVEDVAFRSMDKRLAEFLFKKLDDGGVNAVIEVTHEQIAFELGTAREVISRLLKEFQRNKIVDLARGKVKIVKKEELKNIIEK